MAAQSEFDEMPPAAFAPAPIALAPGIARTRSRLAVRALALLPALLCAVTALAPPLNHDVAAVLNFAERWLAGARLYGDLIDVNPPLIFVLNLPAAALGAWTPLTATHALLGLVFALCALAAVLCRRLLRPDGRITAAALGVALPLTTLAAGGDFAQREHLMLVAALPYLLLAAHRVTGTRTRPTLAVGVALLAAVGFALKPHFLAIPLLVEALVLASRGRAAFRDPVPWAMAATWLAYLVSIPLLFPAYFGYVVPLVWTYYVDLGGLGWWDVLVTERLGTVLLVLAPLLAATFAWSGAGPLPRVLALAAVGAAIAAAVQQKGWSYHAMPARLLTGLLAVALAAAWLDRALPAMRAAAAAPVAGAVAAGALLAFAWTGGEAPWRQLTWPGSRGAAMATALRQEAYGERLLVLSPDIFPVYPALNIAHAQSTLRTMNLWLLQGVYARCPATGRRYRETWDMPRAEFFVYRTVAEDFSRAPPAAVLVSEFPGIPDCAGQRFDLVEYFSRHPAFADTFRRYRPVAASVRGYRLYRLED